MSEGGVVIMGAGLAGLTAGRILAGAGADCLVLEGSGNVGGLCRTEKVDGFAFDYTGHLLHMKDGEGRDLILSLLGDGLAEHARRASIFVKGTFVPYPIQAHFGKLPADEARRCMRDLLEAGDRPASPDLPFTAWAQRQFGKALAEIFMIPYNRKLYVHPLEEMEVSWTSWSVPRPTVEEIEGIADGREAPSYGYNASFFYPRRGGISLLPGALAAGLGNRIRTGARVVGVDAGARTVRLAGGEKIPYGQLINTAPLPDFLRLTEGLPGGIAGSVGKFRHSSVLGVCLGLDGPVRTKDHWVYFPGEEFPFYRIGFPPNFSGDAAPAGCGSLYVEAAFRPGEPPDGDRVARAAMGFLADSGLIEASTGTAARLDLEIPCAYVFHDRNRVESLGPILQGLRERGIHSVSRYGAWEYSGMQEAVEWGIRAAREVLS